MDALRLASQDQDSEKLMRLEMQVAHMQVFLQEMHNQTQRLEKQQRYLAADVGSVVQIIDDPSSSGGGGLGPVVSRTRSMSVLARMTSRPLENYAEGVLTKEAAHNNIARGAPHYPAFERYAVEFGALNASLSAWDRFEIGHYTVLYQGAKGAAWGIYSSELPLLSLLDDNRTEGRATTGLVGSPNDGGVRFILRADSPDSPDYPGPPTPARPHPECMRIGRRAHSRAARKGGVGR